MAIPMAIGMIVQVLYNLIDIYFVAQLGDDAVAGVSAAANIMFLVMALTQILNVGTVALIAKAAGAKDQNSASQIFNQAITVSAIFGLATWLLGVVGAGVYMRAMGSSEASISAGQTYLYWFMPALAMQFAMVAMSGALRGIGVVKPTMLIQILSVLVNMILAPILIAGWGTGYAMGVAGAGLASTLAVLVSVLILAWYFIKHSHYVRFQRALLVPNMEPIKKIVAIGFPAGAEFFLIFIYMAVIYWVIKDFGSAAQAGFGIGTRIMQGFFLPVMAISFAIPAIVGQNLGARLPDRVRQTWVNALYIESALMFLLTIICKWRPESLIAVFSHEAEVIAFGAEFLRIISWNFLGAGVVFACSGLFQGLGNTWPALMSTATRMLTFAIPAVWLGQQAGFEITQLWYLSVATMIAQAALSFALARRALGRVNHSVHA